MKRALSLCLAALIATGCGSGDDGDDGESNPPAPPPTAADLATFESPRIGFTFEYPKELEAEERPRGNVLARVSVERGARLNAIEVRRIARRELALARYLEDFRRDFARTVGQVDKRREQIGDLDVGVLEFETDKLTSASYFFKGAGQTWQVACVADAEHRRAVEAACTTVLASVDFDG